MVVLLTTASLEGQHLAKSFFNTGLLGAAGSSGPSDDQFNRVSFLSHFEGSNNGVNNAFDDGSTSNHTITANGNVTQGSFGPFARPDGEWGWDFDGDDYLTIAYSSDFNFGTGSFTVEAFVFLKDLSGIQGIYSTNTGANPVPKIVMYLDGATPKLHINALNGSGNLSLNSTTDITVGTWNHIAFVRNSSTWYWFINGTQAGTGSNSTNITFSNVATTIGYGGESYFSAMNGFISNFRVVNGTALYTSNFTAPTSPLTAITNTKLLTCQSNRFVDNSASAHTFTLSGNPAVTAFGPILTSSVYKAGTNGASAYFDNSGDSLSIPSSSDFGFGTGDYTISFMVFLTAINDYDTILAVGSGNNGLGLFIQNGVNLAFGRAGTAVDVTFSNVFTGLGQWNSIVFKRASGVVTVYVNGSSVGTNNTSSSQFDYQAAAISIGTETNGSANPFGGIISNFRIVKGTALTPSSGFPTSNLTAVTNTKLLLNMADGQAIDSAAQNNLTLVADSKISTAQKKIGTSSLYVDGSGDYVTFPNTPFGTGDFTVECWVRCLGTSYDKGIWDNHTSSGSSDGLTLTRISEQQFRLFGTGELIRSGNFTITNTWVNVTVVRSSGTLNLFVNGVSQGTTSFTTDLNSVADFVIGGGRYRTGGPETGSLNAYIDEFRISHMARYTSNFTPDTEPFADKGQ